MPPLPIRVPYTMIMFNRSWLKKKIKRERGGREREKEENRLIGERKKKKRRERLEEEEATILHRRKYTLSLGLSSISRPISSTRGGST